MLHPLPRRTAMAALRLAAPAVLAAAGLAASVIPAASAAAYTGPASAPATARRAPWLITGDAVALASPPIAAGPGIVLPAAGGTAGSLVTMKAGGTTYEVPAAALPYLSRGLNPSLFDATALLAAESAGRLPVRIRHAGRQPVLPGVTITADHNGIAQGYLTWSSAKQFGIALARQFAADHASGGYGRDGMFRGGLSVSLAGAATASFAPGGRADQISPRHPMRTLTFTGTNRAGRPDTGDLVLIANVDNSGLLNIGDSTADFYHGVAKVSVPAGHYFAIGFFFGSSADGAPFPVTHALDVLPQFTVAGNTVVRVAERAAVSKITMVTPRPAAVRDTFFDIVRTARYGPAQAFGFANYRWLGGNSPIWVSPTTRRPAAGRLATVTDQWLASAAGAARYEYDLAYQNLTGIILPRHLVRAASLATIQARYFLAATGGFLSRVSSFPVQDGTLFFPYEPVNVPGARIVYSSAAPDLIWTTSLYTADHGSPGTLLQSDAARVYRAGERVSENWGAYPLHPAANVDLIGSRGVPGGYVTTPSASRSGDMLTLDFTPFSDNTPGHTGGGFATDGGSRQVSGSYEIDQNGTQIAGGNALTGAGFTPDLRVQAALSPARATIRFRLTAALGGAAGHLSAQSKTTWTWISAHESGATVPAGWQCGSGGRRCRAEPLLTLGYSVPGMSPDGSTPPGRQRLCLSVGHLPLARATPITGAAVKVSFDGGSTWRAAQVTAGRRGRFCAAFTAPAGALVTLRTSAADAAGGSIGETITSAYRVAS